MSEEVILFNWIKALNPKVWIVNSLKSLAIYEIEVEGDRLQNELRERIAKEGPSAIDRTIDAAQRRIRVAIETKGPTWVFLAPVREKLSAAIQAWGDALQANIKKEVAAYGPTAVDLAFDKAQAVLISQIEKLSI